VKRALLLVAASTLIAVVPAWAAKPTHPVHPQHPSHSKDPCKTLSEGYRANGTLVAATLTPAAKKDHFDGSLTVDVTRANHRAATGSQSFALSDARVRFGKSVTSTTTTAGDRVTLHGKLTVLPHGCSTANFTPVITLHHVGILAPRQ